jgi:hypothetical protein
MQDALIIYRTQQKLCSFVCMSACPNVRYELSARRCCSNARLRGYEYLLKVNEYVRECMLDTFCGGLELTPQN